MPPIFYKNTTLHCPVCVAPIFLQVSVPVNLQKKSERYEIIIKCAIIRTTEFTIKRQKKL